MSTKISTTTNNTTKVAKPATKEVKPLDLQKVDTTQSNDDATPRMEEVKKEKKPRKVEKTIGGLNLEQYLRALLIRDANIQLSAALATWDMITAQIANGDLKNTSRSNKNKKPSTDEPKEKTPYQKFGIWLKEQTPEYKAMKLTEFTQLQASLWKAAEGDEWKQENNYVEPVSSKKNKKPSKPADDNDDEEEKAPVKPAKKPTAAAVKPAKVVKKPAKVPEPEPESDVEADDFEDDQEVEDDDE